MAIAAMGPLFVAELPVRKFHGVGPETAAKMERLGIATGEDLREKTLDFLQAHFGRSREWYYRIARGIDYRAVQPTANGNQSAPRIPSPKIS